MKKNCQKPTTNVVLVQPAQLITDSGDQVKTVNSGDTGITYGGGTGNALSRRGGWDDDEE